MKTEKGVELAQKHENIRDEIIMDGNTPKQLKDKLIKLKEQFDHQKIDDEKYIEQNKHREIIGYTENFLPIYKNN